MVFCGATAKSLAQVIGGILKFVWSSFCCTKKVFWGIYTVTGDFSKG